MIERHARCSLRREGKAPEVRPGSLRLPVVSGIGAVAAAAGIASTLLWPPRPVLLWNASPSSPIGLYAVTSFGRIAAGDTIVAWAPASARRLAAARNYLPFNVPLVKRVAAAPGGRVCATRMTIFVNGRPAALRRVRDPSGRPLPWWSGCRLLRPGELFLLSPDAPDAFDGRYFGVTSSSQIVGKARLLWPR
ncbi:MAG TPA: S26 family signal peptidase [Sphingomicrobium sp.]|nr:S26 family signal peptidase [Sphingomicrobium sp.]